MSRWPPLKASLMSMRHTGILVPAFVLAVGLIAAEEASAQQPAVMVSTARSNGPANRQYHVAQDGDTLYDLAQRYLGDSMMWPLLWSYNPQVTNPHWIYPGDIVFLGPESVSGTLTFGTTGGRIFPLGGFYTSGEVEVTGQLRYADTGRRLLAEDDTVYLEFENPDDVRVGDLYALNRVVGRVHNDDDELLAVKYLVAGTVQVTSFHEETELVSAVITDMWDTIERGDPLFLSQPQLLNVVPVANTVTATAEIIDRLRQGRMMHEQDFVFINLGFNDGVVPGNRFTIWRRDDEGAEFDVQFDQRGGGADSPAQRRAERRAARERGESDPADLTYAEIQELLPWQVAGEAMVLWSSDEYCTAVITSAGLYELEIDPELTESTGRPALTNYRVTIEAETP
jgi:hypothetical protein